MRNDMRVALFDYGAGNLHSLAKALASPGVEVAIESDAHRLTAADAVVLPGVGAFGAAAARLAPGRDALADALRDGLPCLGICLGMQLLFDASDEGEDLPGLGLIGGQVTRLRARHVPQIGWNAVEAQLSCGSDSLLARSGLEVAYYANSFACRPADDGVVRAWSEHEGDRFPAMVRAWDTVGVQFHPEKSSAPGVRFVRAWLDEVREARARSGR
jgi:glutamine amidotransferase